MSNKEAKELDDLNQVLSILREAADKNGLLAAPCVTTVQAKTSEFSFTRINYLVGRLTELGWREDTQTGPKNQRGSKIRLRPLRITSLDVLEEVANKRKQDKELQQEVHFWQHRNGRSLKGKWGLISKDGKTVIVELLKENYCPKRQDIGGWSYSFRLVNLTRNPAWLANLLTHAGQLGISTLYKLYQEKRAAPVKDD